jgi:outer membrane protein assembly factor BamB
MSVTPMTIGFAGPEVRLYVGCENHRLYCLSTAANPANRMIWSFTANQAIFAAPSFYAGNVYFGCATSTTENLYCLNAESGKLIWDEELWDEVRATPACANGAIVVGDDTGKRLYQRCYARGLTFPEESEGGNPFNASEHRPVLAGMADWFLSSVALTSAGLIFVGNDNYALYALRSLDLGHLTSVGTGGEVRSSPAVSYACQPGYRWIFVTTKASGGLLLAFRQTID